MGVESKVSTLLVAKSFRLVWCSFSFALSALARSLYRTNPKLCANSTSLKSSPNTHFWFFIFSRKPIVTPCSSATCVLGNANRAHQSSYYSDLNNILQSKIDGDMKTA